MKSNDVKNLQENEMSKIIINNYSDVADEEVVGRVLKTMNEYKKYRSWVQDGELKRKVIGYTIQSKKTWTYKSFQTY